MLEVLLVSDILVDSYNSILFYDSVKPYRIQGSTLTVGFLVLDNWKLKSGY
jgi:hypothetical protein